MARDRSCSIIINLLNEANRGKGLGHLGQFPLLVH